MDPAQRDLSWYWMAGGWAMYPIALLGALFALAVLAALGLSLTPKGAKASMILGIVSAAGGVLIAGIGVFGSTMERSRMMEAVANVNPADREAILHEGSLEAAVPTKFGLSVGVPILALGGLAAGVGGARRNKAAPPPAS
jgi:hypothetical protein